MNFVKILLIGLILFLFTGCSDSRENAVTGMFDALKAGDIVELEKYTTSSTSQLLILGATMQCGVKQNDFNSKNEMTSHCLEKMFSNIEVKEIKIEEISETRAKAIVNEINNGEKVTETLDLIKVNDLWKVNINK